MAKIKIVVDSATDIPREILERYNITVLPFPIYFGDEMFRDGIDINTDLFYPKLKEFGGFPTTSQITPIEFKEAYEKLAKEADIILSIHLSSPLSGTFNSARLASLEVDNAQVICIDSRNAALGYGFQVIEAAKAIEEGAEIDEVLARIQQVKDTVKVYLSVPSLDYLVKGGRIGKATAFLGGLLNIIPLLTIEDGIVAPFEKIRGKKRVFQRLMELVQKAIKQFGGKDKINLAVLHTDNHQEADNLAERIKAEYGIRDIIITQVGPLIGTHIGPGVLAVIFHKKTS